MKYDTIGGRRFLLCVLVDLGTFVLQWFEKLDKGGSTLGLIVVGTAGAYIAGNIAQRKIEAPK